MKLSTRTRYGLRAMVNIASRDGQSTCEMVAQCEEVSRKYLEEIMGRLRSAGLIHTLRGAKGGVVLARPPEEIKVGEVVEAMEKGLGLVPCVDDDTYCARQGDCPTRPVWAELSTAIRRSLDAITLADLVRQ